MGDCGAGKLGIVMSESEELVTFVTLGVEDPVRNISERHKIV
jgi:hypothetical protein